ncbi:hypothetical protein CEW92_00340 [Bacillaceae bacterium SAS-127]|nr:hypothetical protein CEW92_00340 [Bacillaceae bacterium SAS-127]
MSVLASVNGGDILFQLFMLLFVLGIPAIVIVATMYFIRSGKRRNEQLQRLEDKIDQLENKSE